MGAKVAKYPIEELPVGLGAVVGLRVQPIHDKAHTLAPFQLLITRKDALVEGTAS